MHARLPITLVLAAVLAGAFLAPVQPMYASSASMSPAIDQGDLYFVLEGAAVGAGDVVAFESADLDTTVTHRVVGEKAAGYVTKGDANPSTDQEAGHPIVARSSVVGPVVEVNGRPVTVAGAGALAARLSTVRTGLLGLGVLLVLLVLTTGIFGPNRSVPTRDVVCVGDVLTPVFVGSLLVGLLLIFWGASTHELNYVASQGGVTAAHTVPVGEAAIRTVEIDTYTLPFTAVIVEASGVAVLERTTTPTGLELLVEVPAQTSTGLYQSSVAVSAYPATLPLGVIEWLHGIHWLAAALGTLAPVSVPVYLLYVIFVDSRMPVRWPAVRLFNRVRGF